MPQNQHCTEGATRTENPCQWSRNVTGVLRISLDAKAKIKVGPFARGGYSRQHKEGIDHDFDPDVILGLFGFFLPEYDDTHFFFSKSKITADFIVDTLEILWVKLKKKNTKLSSRPVSSSKQIVKHLRLRLAARGYYIS